MPGTTKLCICGGGNGAHALAGLAASRVGVEVRVLTLFADEAEKWSKILESNDLTVVLNEKNGSQRELKSKPVIVTKNPEEVVPNSDVIIFCVPAFAHEGYFKAIEPYIEKKALLVGLPGQAGFEFQCRDILGPKSALISMMSFETLPWACRIRDFGSKVEVLSTKTFLTGALIRGKSITKPPLMTLQMFHGSEPILRQAKHFLEILIMSYSFVHPAILYGKWKTWDGKPVAEVPLFYHGIDQATADLLTSCSDECKEVSNAIMEKHPNVNLSDVKSIYDWYVEYYSDGITDSRDLFHAITTNKSYEGLTHPMKEVDGGFVPDFTSRYITEELPMGMVVFRGVADAAGVKIPSNNMLIEWAQEKIGKEYLVDGELKGKDVENTRCPQRYGFNTIEAIISGYKE